MSSIEIQAEIMDTKSIASRLRLVIHYAVNKARRFKELEEISAIPATHWRNFYSGKQRPTAEMIEAVAKRWPEYAFWLMTGLDDRTRGHNDPTEYWRPEDGGLPSDKYLPHLERTAAGKLFRAEIERNDYICAKLIENQHFEEDENLVKLESRIAQLRHVRDEEERAMAELEKNDGN